MMNRIPKIFTLGVALAGSTAVVAPEADGQATRLPPGRSMAMLGVVGDPDRAVLGIVTTAGGLRDTLGVLVQSVTSGSPADKAGITEGSRLQSINGVNLKLSRDDAADEHMQGMSQNRLTREMRKVKAGDEVALEVWADGRTRSIRVKTVTAESLAPSRPLAGARWRDADRAAVGIVFGATGTKRDTAGVFVQRVSEGGPAEKAGIIEGDRIASINGIDLRVAREDAGDVRAAAARIERLQREVEKLKPGESVALVVVSAGRSRTVTVTTVRVGELPDDAGFAFSFGPGARTIIRDEIEREMFRMMDEHRLSLPDRIILRPNVTVRTIRSNVIL